MTHPTPFTSITHTTAPDGTPALLAVDVDGRRWRRAAGTEDVPKNWVELLPSSDVTP